MLTCDKCQDRGVLEPCLLHYEYCDCAEGQECRDAQIIEKNTSNGRSVIFLSKAEYAGLEELMRKPPPPVTKAMVESFQEFLKLERDNDPSK